MRLVAWGISVINFYNNDLKEIQCLYFWVEEELIKMSEIFNLKENGYDVTVFLWSNVEEVADFIAAATGMTLADALEAALQEECTVGQVHIFVGSTKAHIHVAKWMCSSSKEVKFVLGHEIGHLNGNLSNGERCNQIEGRCDAWGARYADLKPRQMAGFIRRISRTPKEYRERLRSAIQEIRSWS